MFGSNRAECTDIANAVLEGADGICLTNTTAVGKYPTETVEMTRRQYKEVEKAINHRKKYQDMRDYQLDSGQGHMPGAPCLDENLFVLSYWMTFAIRSFIPPTATTNCGVDC